MSDSPIRVFVLEDQPAILKAQIKVLNASPEVEIVGSAMSGEQALEEINADVDVLLSDLGLPGIDGIEVTKRMKEKYPDVEILIFTIFEEEDKVLAAVKAGAAGYLLKGASQQKIVDAIKDVHNGGSVIHPRLARILMDRFKVPIQQDYGLEPIETPLTNREVEILQVISRGLSNSEAAGVLGLSRATVRTHLEHIYEKLEVGNRVEAVTEGIRHGIIDL
ncbi:MAG: response regulator transcription factor [Myxococcota bacterium]|nr:response regulator transcription factor [Myxococcota bacterium]